jgi:hypothetical protein
MKYPLSIALTLTLAAGGSAVAADDSSRMGHLRVLYVGNTGTERGRSYVKFLDEKFALVSAVDRRKFDPGSLPDVDVVVLDWSQSDIDYNSRAARNPAGWESDLKSPLGERSRWTKPTVLLGSAGHLLAAPWKVVGGSG